MSEFVGGFAPILVMWAVPLVPMLYAAIAAVLESLTLPARRARPEALERGEAAVGERRALDGRGLLRRRSPRAPG